MTPDEKLSSLESLMLEKRLNGRRDNREMEDVKSMTQLTYGLINKIDGSRGPGMLTVHSHKKRSEQQTD